MLPPNMRILTRGTGGVLGLIAAVSVVAGLATRNPLITLNAIGFIGTCALSLAAIFYSVALERIGFDAARTAATALVRVLAWSAATMGLLFFVLLSQARFEEEASRFGFHSVAGLLVIVVLAAVLALLWRDRP